MHGDHSADDSALPDTRETQHALLHSHDSELGGCVRAGRERRPSVASARVVQPLRAIAACWRARVAVSARSVLSTHGRRGGSAASSGARKPDAGRSSATRLCGVCGGQAGWATPGGADAPQSEHTHTRYEVVVVNKLEVHVEA